MERVFNKTSKVIIAIIALLTIIGIASNSLAATQNTGRVTLVTSNGTVGVDCLQKITFNVWKKRFCKKDCI